MAWLRFQMDLSDTPSDTLILGELAILDGDSVIKTFPATSGRVPHQHKRSQSLKARGPIPSCDSVRLDSYFVRTNPLDRSENPGIGGNFYWVDIPEKVTIDRIERSEFGIHFDANQDIFPGSAGCIVFSDETEWDSFEKFIADYNTQGFSHISLVVEYNQPPAPPVNPIFKIVAPKDKSLLQVNEKATFRGSANPEVKKIVVTAGPGGPFPVGEAIPDAQGLWIFQKNLVNTGEDRPFLFVAQDELGNKLQEQELTLTLINAGQVLPASKFFTVTEPISGAQKQVNRTVKFSGTAKPEVKAIVASAGPEGPFKIGTVVPVGEKWEFDYSFNGAGVDRPIWISAFDINGNPLETAEIKLSITPGDANLAKIPVVSGPDGESQDWRSAARPHIPTLVKAFQDQGIFSPIVYAYACASISRESSWDPNAENTTDDAARSGFPGRGLAQITWDFNYKTAQEDTGIRFFDDIDLMFIPYNALRAKAAFFKRNGMIPFIEAGDYESAAGIYNAGSPRFRGVYTRRVANDVPFWIPVFKTIP
jgi:hypothetical protein